MRPGSPSGALYSPRSAALAAAHRSCAHAMAHAQEKVGRVGQYCMRVGAGMGISGACPALSERSSPQWHAACACAVTLRKSVSRPRKNSLTYRRVRTTAAAASGKGSMGAGTAGPSSHSRSALRPPGSRIGLNEHHHRLSEPLGDAASASLRPH